MTKVIYFFSLFFISVLQQESDFVYTVTERNFKNTVLQQNDLEWMILIHSPNCHHCVEFKPTYEQIAQSMQNSQVQFGEINCEKQYLLCDQLQIKRYPTMLFMKNGLMYEYQGRRDVDQIRTFIENDWQGMKAVVIPRDLPSLKKQFIDGIEALKEEVIYVFSMEKNYTLKILFGFAVFVIFAVAFMFLYIIVLMGKLLVEKKQMQGEKIQKDRKNEKLKTEQLNFLSYIQIFF